MDNQELEQENTPIMEIISWEIPEYQKHSRSKLWYILASVVAIAMLIYAVSTVNFLFAAIIIISGLILIINDARNPQGVLVTIANEGVMVGRRFYDYDELSTFSIVYKPNIGVKKIYFSFKSKTKHHLAIPLLDVNPLFLRDNLNNYLEEDLERTDETATESISKMLKL
ncbi:MAG: hypothetical protein NTY12_04000 [Candidatus Falkowbacteria bacterium]|nr:hypothetical protein [Candidatus Falkowbacteria bacterium]